MTHWKKMSKRRKILIVVSVLLLLAAAGCAAYLGDYYHADLAAVEAFEAASVEMETMENGDLVWEPDGAAAGLIFYPGGKVEHRAYIPLMEALAARDILCVLVEMPLRLAVFDMDAAEGIQAMYPQIENWYIGGHSLGGSMAASYLAGCEEPFRGLVLLGSYSTADLTETGCQVLTMFGSEDRVLNREKYEECRTNLPEDHMEIVIDGGCHAGFGMYGAQEGDGTPAISSREQILLSADAIASLMGQGT